MASAEAVMDDPLTSLRFAEGRLASHFLQPLSALTAASLSSPGKTSSTLILSSSRHAQTLGYFCL